MLSQEEHPDHPFNTKGRSCRFQRQTPATPCGGPSPTPETRLGDGHALRQLAAVGGYTRPAPLRPLGGTPQRPPKFSSEVESWLAQWSSFTPSFPFSLLTLWLGFPGVTSPKTTCTHMPVSGSPSGRTQPKTWSSQGGVGVQHAKEVAITFSFCVKPQAHFPPEASN